MIRLDDLPSDPVLLKHKLIAMASVIENVSAEKIVLADERNVAVAQRDAALQENEKLLLILSQYKRALFGRRSEKMDSAQLQLLLSANEQPIAPSAANENAPADGAGKGTQADAPEKPPRPRPNRNRGMLPVHLPRVDVVIDVGSKSCSCCGGPLHKIGETVKEMLDVVPVQYRVKRLVRPRYGCRGCESAVVQAPAPAQPIDGGMATETVLAHVATMKYGYQVPLYRQEQMLASQGIDLDRATLALWMGRLAWWLKPLHEVLLDTVLSYPKLFADETPLPVLDPGRGKTKTCRLWVAAMDDRPWDGPAPPAVVYVFAEDRRGEHATNLFAGVQRHFAGRWVRWLQWPARSAAPGRPGDVCFLLRPCTPQVL